MRTFIAGIDVDRRLWRDRLRPLHMVPAPPQAVVNTADAGAADDGDYGLEERSAGNTPRRRPVGDMFQGDLARHGLILLPI